MLVGALALSSVAGYAQNYPERPITIVVAFSPGGASDRLARVITGGDELSKILGQPVVVENRPGGGGYLAWRSIQQAKPDGYTLLLGENAIAINTALRPDEPLDPRTALDPIAKIGVGYVSVGVNNALPAATFQDFVAYSQANDIDYGSSGLGSVSHMTFAAIADIAGAKAQHIPFTGGGELQASVLGGHTDAMVASIGSAVQMASTGNFRVLAVSSPERLEAFPDAPTLAELGHKSDVVLGFWWGLFAPPGLPQDIADKLESAIEELLTKPAMLESVARAEVQVDFAPSEEFAALLNSEIESWAKIAEALDISLE